jgi:hypothetical protein
MREAILSVVGRALPIVVVIGVIAMLVQETMIIVVERVLVMRVAVMSIGFSVLMVMVPLVVFVLVGAMAERVMLDSVVMHTQSVVKRHVHRRQDLESRDPEQAGQHRSHTDTALSRTTVHGWPTVAIFPWPINQR